MLRNGVFRSQAFFFNAVLCFVCLRCGISGCDMRRVYVFTISFDLIFI